MTKANIGNILLQQEILLESGTNELEVLVFRVAHHVFGINVAKVREVLPRMQITKLAKAHPSIRGVFKLRDKVVPCVSLVDHLRVQNANPDGEQFMILAELNGQQTAFLVDQVERIHRLSWKSIMSVPSLMQVADTPVTGIVRIENRLVVMLDFETVLVQVMEVEVVAQQVANERQVARGDAKVILADDSPTVRRAIGSTLEASGYTNVKYCENGQEAWQLLDASLQPGKTRFDIVISDVEMPQMDGFHLCKRVKEHPQLRDMPVMLYSSIVTPDNLKKGKAVGADAQVAKPDLATVVLLSDDLLLERGKSAAASSAPAAGTTPSSPAQSPTVVATQPTVPVVPIHNRRDPQLWQTFRAELKDLSTALQKTLIDVASGVTPEKMQQAFRTLHTIKSASMVIPVSEISSLTHNLETRIEAAQKEPSLWPSHALQEYVEWLDRIAHNVEDVDATLAEVAEIALLLEACAV